MRVHHYLAGASEEKLRRIVENELITIRCKTLLEMEGGGFICMLRDHKSSDLKRMYLLFSRVPTCLDQLRETLGALLLYSLIYILLLSISSSSTAYLLPLYPHPLQYSSISSTSFSSSSISSSDEAH